VQIFADAEAVVSPSGSCTAMVRHYFPELLGETAQAVAARTFELTDFLVNKLGVTDVGARFPAHVTYHDSCHALRELRIKDAPRRLLAAVEGLELIEMASSERCCGFGGTFSVRYPDVSVAMADSKLADIDGAGVDALVSGDGGCLLHLSGRMSRTGSKVRALHLASLLAEAL